MFGYNDKLHALIATAVIGLGSLGYTTTSDADIVNIDAVSNSIGNPVEVFLEPGTYIVEPIGVSSGGAFDAWNPFGFTTCSDPDGCVPVAPSYPDKGWIHTYSVQSSNISSVNVNGVDITPVTISPDLPEAVFQTFFLDTAGDVRFNVGSELLYPGADLALLAGLTSTFTLDVAGFVGFAILDDPYHDNLGGVSLNLSAIPVPAAVWLFGSGLFGLIGVARRRKYSH